jgi:hypothetical protein
LPPSDGRRGGIDFQARDAGVDTRAGRQAMHIAMSNTLALIDWHDLRLFLGDFMSDGGVWLLIGFLVAIVALSAFAAEATLVMHTAHRRQSLARWAADSLAADNSESAIPDAPVEAMMK